MPFTVLVPYVLIVLVTVALHEALHYITAKMLGYRPRPLINRVGVGFYIPDSVVKSQRDAIIILLAPQLLTTLYYIIGYSISGLIGLLLLMAGFINYLGSVGDFYETVRFTHKNRIALL